MENIDVIFNNAVKEVESLKSQQAVIKSKIDSLVESLGLDVNVSEDIISEEVAKVDLLILTKEKELEALLDKVGKLQNEF